MSRWTELQIYQEQPESAALKRLTPTPVEGFDVITPNIDNPHILFLMNAMREPLQTIISVDGINILSGKQADIDPSQPTWYLPPHGELFVHSKSPNARFSLSHIETSLAPHVSDFGSNGVISVALFREPGARGVATRRAGPSTDDNQFQRPILTNFIHLRYTQPEALYNLLAQAGNTTDFS